jgi:hypothetical protein
MTHISEPGSMEGKNMRAWDNVEISADDPEITGINKLEETLGELPGEVLKIRKLITGFEVCHSKFERHIGYLKEAISKLKSPFDLEDVGATHIRKGEDAWKKDSTGRSRLGQEYVWILQKWLGKDAGISDGMITPEQERQVTDWLGGSHPEKERLVRLLIARLVWDWESYEKLITDKDHKELEYQVCRMDICHYGFPENLNRVLKGIGKLEPAEAFEGCGSFNPQIEDTARKEFEILNDSLKFIFDSEQKGTQEMMKAWLTACLAKTLKEQVKLDSHIYFKP